MDILIEKIDSMQKILIDESKTTKKGDKDFKKGLDAVLTTTTLLKIKAKEIKETVERAQITDAAMTCYFEGLQKTAKPDSTELIEYGNTYYKDCYK